MRKFLTCCVIFVLASSASAGEKQPLGDGLVGTMAACGGLAGVECPPGMTCIDDPTDDCDPAAGGMDCVGICASRPLDTPMFPETLTVYSGRYAFVEEVLTVNLAAGVSTTFVEVASTAVPDSIVFMPSGSGVILRDQRYTPGRRLDAASIFKEHIGDTVRIMVVGGVLNQSIEGTLINADNEMVVATLNGIEIVRDYRRVQLVGAQLLNSQTKSGIYLDLFTDTGGQFDTRLFYETRGIGWKAHYNAILSDAPTLAEVSVEKGRFLRMDFHGQATITNGSDKPYNFATVRLVAGDVRRQRGGRLEMRSAPGLMQMDARAETKGFEQKAFFEHHLYTLGRRLSIPKQSSVQTALFPVINDMAAEKALVFNASPPVSRYPVIRPNTGHVGTIDISLRFQNTSEHPWPAGTIRFSKVDSAKLQTTLVFVGEGAIGHTPPDQSLSLPIGTAFDVKAERRQTSFDVKHSNPGRPGNKVIEITESFETTIHNHKDTAVTVYVRETMWRGLAHYTFGIDSIKKKYKHTTDAAKRVVEIELHIPPKSKETVRYDIRYFR